MSKEIMKAIKHEAQLLKDNLGQSILLQHNILVLIQSMPKVEYGLYEEQVDRELKRINNKISKLCQQKMLPRRKKGR